MHPSSALSLARAQPTLLKRMINLEETRDNIKKSSKTDTATAMLKGTERWIQVYCRKEWESWWGEGIMRTSMLES